MRRGPSTRKGAASQRVLRRISTLTHTQRKPPPDSMHHLDSLKFSRRQAHSLHKVLPQALQVTDSPASLPFGERPDAPSHSKSNYQPSDLRRCGTGSKSSPATRRQSFLTEQSRRPSHAGHSDTRALKTSHAERELPPVARTPDLRWLRPPGRMPPCRLLTLLSFVVVLLSWPVRGPSRCLRWRRICGFLSRVCGIGWPRPMPMNAGARRA